MRQEQPKYIFITGGVCSSLGKGLTAAAIGMLLEKHGWKVALMKFDPYLNVDPGTMNPYQHGEVYVTDDGAETDLDLGHYYRYTNSPLSRASSVSTGQIYETVIKRERHGDYLGKTVQVIPHITDEIKQRILACGKQEENIEVVIIEIGGTVGDIESLPFLEAIRQFRYECGRECLNIHLTYVPYIKAAGEVKTKPSQHSVQALREIGIFPDFVICRCEHPLDDDVKEKLSLFCNVPREAVIEEADVQHSIYELPISLHEQALDEMICNRLGLSHRTIHLNEWKEIIDKICHPKGVITVGVVGKYMQHQDAYKSVFEALHHAAIAEGYKIEIKRFDADKILSHETIEENALHGCDGCLIPGGFGERGWEGKILAARYAREQKIPFFGICLGMQVLTVEYARNVLGLAEANSTEIDPETKHPVISLLDEQSQVKNVGGTMRLGSYICQLQPKTKAFAAYGQERIGERHRHRYEFNNKYRQEMEDHGLVLSGLLDEGTLCEIVEIKDHPWMVGVQFHPEFKSKPTAPHPLFHAFVRAMIAEKKRKKKEGGS